MNINEFFDRVFMINLARRTDRRAMAAAELMINGIEPSLVEWVAGFDHPTNGHAGCSRSHRDLIRRISNGPWNRVLVLEDDYQSITGLDLKLAGFTPDSQVWKTYTSIPGVGIQQRFHAMSHLIPDDWDVLYLGGGYAEPPIARVNKHVIRCGHMLTTSSYGITREHAKVWTEKVDAICAPLDMDNQPEPIDHLFGLLSHDHRYYVFQPRLTFQRAIRSDITGESNSYLLSMTDPVHENMV